MQPAAVRAGVRREVLRTSTGDVELTCSHTILTTATSNCNLDQLRTRYLILLIGRWTGGLCEGPLPECSRLCLATRPPVFWSLQLVIVDFITQQSTTHQP